jgi:hypothetical protein
MTEVKTVCQYFKKQIVVERNHFGVGEHAHSLQDIRCSRCSKRWKEDLSVTLAKAVPALSSNLAELRVQVRVQLDELMTKINALFASHSAAAQQTRFNPQGVEKNDFAAVSPETCRLLPACLSLQPINTREKQIETC